MHVFVFHTQTSLLCDDDNHEDPHSEAMLPANDLLIGDSVPRANVGHLQPGHESHVSSDRSNRDEMGAVVSDDHNADVSVLTPRIQLRANLVGASGDCDNEVAVHGSKYLAAKRRKMSKRCVPRVAKIKPYSPLRIYNTVWTVQLEQENTPGRTALNLHNIAWKMFGRYSSQRFPAASFRNIDPFCTFSLFRGGKIVFTGLNSRDQVLFTSWMFATRLETLENIPLKVCGLKRENIVGSLCLGHAVDLKRLSTVLPTHHPKISHMYEPDTFPGLQLWVKEDKANIVLIIFDSGSVVIAGAKEIEQLPKVVRIAKTYISRSQLLISQASPSPSPDPDTMSE
jgi:transcription initiation factor TFIID TATA-box-binding protein